MISLIYMYLAVAALVSLQCGLAAHIDNSKLDNNIQTNVIPAPAQKRRVIRNFVRIPEPPPMTVRHVPGTTSELECFAMGKPAPSIVWLKNGEPLNDYDEEANDILTTHQNSMAGLTSKLILTAPSNGDVYTCVATAGIKRATATSTVFTEDEDEELLAIEKLLFKPTKPTITMYYNDIFQDYGTDVILPCRVFSFTKSQIVWQDPDENIIYGNSGRMQVLPSGDLLITGLKWSDMGNFTCTAKNMYGKESVDTFMYPLKPQ